MPRYLYPPQFQNLSGAPCFLPNPPQGQGASCVSPPLLAAQFTIANSEYLSATGSAELRGSTSGWWRALWIYSDASPTFDTPIACYGSPSGYIVQINGGTMYFNVGNGSGAPQAVLGGFTSGAWHLLYIEYDGTNIGISLDGGALTTQALGATYSQGSADFYIGSWNGGDLWGGRIFCVGLGDGTLDSGELAAFYNSGEPLAYCALPAAVKAKLTSFWNMDEESGARADSHGSNDLTDNNTVTSVAWNS